MLIITEVAVPVESFPPPSPSLISVLKSVLYVNGPPGCAGLFLDGKVDDFLPFGEVVEMRPPTNPGVDGKNGVAEKKLLRDVIPSTSSSQGLKWSAILDGDAFTGLSYLVK